MEKDFRIILPEGTISLFSEQKRVNNALLPKEVRATQVASMNSGENLIKMLNTDSFYRKNFGQKGVVETIKPLYTYSYGGVMVAAARELSLGDSLVEAFNIFDCDQIVQKEYFRQIIGSILTHAKMLLPGETENLDKFGVRVLAYENNNVSLGTEKRNMPRSIALPHTIVIRNGDWINRDQTPKVGYDLRTENRVLKDVVLYKEFETFFGGALSEANPGISISLSHRQAKPYGYTINAGMTSSEDLDYQAERLNKIMLLNHNFFTRFMLSKIENLDAKRSKSKSHAHKSLENVFIPQPSYRSYIYYDKENLFVTISPQILSPTGAIDACGIGIQWGNEIPNPFKDGELNLFFKEFTKMLESALRTS